MLAEVIMAIVAEPWTVRIAAVTKNTNGNNINPGNPSAIDPTASAMPA